MEEPLKKRLVGAVVIVSLAVIFVPMLLEDEPILNRQIRETNIPPRTLGPFKEEMKAPPPVIESDVHGKAAPSASADTSAEPPGIPATPGSAGDTEAPAVPSPTADAPASTAAETAPDKEPARAEPEKVETAPRGPSAWVVQVGSFSSRDNADGLVERLRKAGFDTFHEEFRLGGKSLYRVRVGPEIDRRRAEKMQVRIADEFKLKGQVLRYP
ncbi:MAG: SPOR domain-containing protein [Pseudomonadota bacterium]